MSAQSIKQPLTEETLQPSNFNGDSKDDLAVGIPLKDFGSISDAGAVRAYYGYSKSPSQSKIFLTSEQQFWSQNTSGIADSSETSDKFGNSLAVGDFDGDGFDDLAIGVPTEDLSNTILSTTIVDAGAVNVIYGYQTGLSTQWDQFWHQSVSPLDGISGWAENGDQFGSALTVGDFNGDGKDDLAVGIPYKDIEGITDTGLVQVFYVFWCRT